MNRTPRGALLQTGHLSSPTIHQFPFKQFVNTGVYSFKLNHWKAAQATVELVNQFAIQSHGLIALLISQAKNRKASSILWKQKYFDSKELSICQIMSKSIMSFRFRSVISLKICSMIELWEYCSGTGEMVHSGLFSSQRSHSQTHWIWEFTKFHKNLCYIIINKICARNKDIWCGTTLALSLN